jgi:hypothetical protein
MLAATPARESGSASSGEVHDSSGCDGRKEAQTWSFKSCVRLKEGQTFSNLLDARKQQMNISLASATVISWACTNNALRLSQDSNVEYFEGFLHAPTLIRLGSLRRVLPEKQTTDAGEIVEVTFEEVHPGPGKDYMYHPTIKTFLEETSLDPLASDKRMRVDYRGSSANTSEIILAKTWFGCGTMRCSDSLRVETIFRSVNVAHRQEATLGSADVISLACAGPRGPEPAAFSTVQVDVLVHSSKHIRCVTLEAWMNSAQNPEIAKFEWEAVQTGKGKSSSSFWRGPSWTRQEQAKGCAST